MKPACYNRPDYQTHTLAPIGWTEDGRRITAYIQDPMSKQCQQHSDKGEATIHGWDCDGCRHKPEGEKIA